MLAAALAAVALGGVSASAAGTGARVGGDRILLSSDRDGTFRGYSMRRDGSHLTPLLSRAQALVPAAVSGDGSTIAYLGGTGIYVSRADGARLRSVVRDSSSDPALSRDGRVLAFSKEGSGIWIVGTNGRGRRRLTSGRDSRPALSPDGKTLAFVRSKGDFAGALVIRPQHGPAHVVAWAEDFGRIEWSPDGRWLAYALGGIWAVRPDGTRRHLLADGGDFAWSPDSRTLAVETRDDVAVVGLHGGLSRLRLSSRGLRSPDEGLSGVYTSGLAWSPDGRWLALEGREFRIWVVGRDGRGLRHAAGRGRQSLLGWTRLSPVLKPAAPIASTERVVGRRVLDVRAQVLDLDADGARVAFITGPTRSDCDHVGVWMPATRSVTRARPAPCGQPHKYVDSLGPVALAGTRFAWGTDGCCGNDEETSVITATLAHPDARSDVADAAVSRGESGGTLADGPVGHGNLIAFAIQSFCDYNAEPGDDYYCPPDRTTGLPTDIWRLGGGGRCPSSYKPVRGCSVVATIDDTASVLAVDAGRIVVATRTDVRLLSVAGRTLRVLAVKATRASLSGNRVALATASGVDVYDTGSGDVVARLGKVGKLQDLESGILVTASKSDVTLRRLSDGRTTTFHVSGPALAQLERPGLFLAGAHRITFTPMREVLRRLGGSAR